jgi:hypothetical protein
MAACVGSKTSFIPMTNSGHRFNTAEELAVCLLMALCMNPANCFQWLDSPPYGLVRYLPFVLTIGYLQTACEQGSLCPPNTYLRTITLVGSTRQADCIPSNRTKPTSSYTINK